MPQSVIYNALSLNVLHFDITQVYIRKPGPRVYYSHFSSLFFASCLLFQSVQFHFMTIRRNKTFSKSWHLGFSYLYWIVLTLSGFLCGVAYAFTPKSDAVAIQFLVFLSALIGGIYLFLMPRNRLTIDFECTQEDRGDHFNQSKIGTNRTAMINHGFSEPIDDLTSSRRNQALRNDRWTKNRQASSKMLLFLFEIIQQILESSPLDIFNHVRCWSSHPGSKLSLLQSV